MRILFYNWVLFDDEARRGGGVTLYLYHLIESLSKDPENQCFFFSSGLEYTFDGKLRIEETKNCFSDNVKSFQIVNSPVHAPACMQFSGLQTYLEDQSLLSLLDEFWEQQGGFDVVHFHNLEGLSLPVLKLKERHPEALFCYSLHNYFLFCPQVNLWTNTGKNCYRDSKFPSCSECVVTSGRKLESLIASFKDLLSRTGDFRNSVLYKILKKIANVIRSVSEQRQRKELKENCQQVSAAQSIFFEYRKQNVSYANQYFDCIFAVSEQVAEIAAFFGIKNEKITVDYIGTEAASKCAYPKEFSGEIVRIGYLGYARADKGFDFFLRGLSRLPLEVRSKLDVLIAAKADAAGDFQKYDSQLQELKASFHSIRFQNGYAKSEQPLLLQQIDLGVVPVQWEDNLPQVAIEYVSAGIPVLTSDMGGAKELCTDFNFIFDGDDPTDFVRKLSNLVEHPGQLADFWKNPPYLTTMESHCQNLIKHYKSNIFV